MIDRTEADLTEILAQQTMVATLLSAAFLLDAPILAATAGLASLAGTLGVPDVYSWVYRRVLVPAGLLPRLSGQNMGARRFARRMAALMAVAGSALVSIGWAATGWSLVLAVVVFAGVSVRFGWCVGCQIHHRLAGSR